MTDPPVPWGPTTYDGLAGAYAAANARMREGLVPFARDVVARAGDGLVVDVGCGTGRDVEWFARQGARVLGVDRSVGMLREARRHTRVALVAGDVLRLPLSDGAAAAIWCVATLIHLPREAFGDAVRELRRVLRRDGTLVIGVQRGEGERLEVDPYVGRFARLMVRFSPSEVLAALADAGFDAREVPVDDEQVGRWVLVVAVLS